MQKAASYIFLLFTFLFFSCAAIYQPQQVSYKNYRISNSNEANNRVHQILRPYSDSVNKTMNEVIGRTSQSLEKKQPESTLGNFMADAVLAMAVANYDTKVDAAFINYGGIRLNQVAAGEITRGKIFELMPFDNVLILQKIRGDVLQQFLDLVAGKGGWPVAGLSMKIKDKKAVDVVINGKPLDPSVIYTIANADYVANGGDDADMLRVIPQHSNGYLVRDAIIDYIKNRKREGKDISATIENRVIYVQ